MKYSRKNPSERYLQLIRFYDEMQKNGYLQTNGKIGNFDGTTVPFFAKIIKKIIMQYRCKSLLDYGCGKAKYYFNDFIVKNEKFPNLKDYWNVKTKLYDPAVKQFNKFTSKKFDISICVDVLEHCPLEDIDWIIEDFISKSQKVVFVNISCSYAMALLPNGQNAHITVRSPKWWEKKFLELSDIYKNLSIIGSCTYLDHKKQTRSYGININDNLINYLE